jgi:hypothetical protein
LHPQYSYPLRSIGRTRLLLDKERMKKDRSRTGKISDFASVLDRTFPQEKYFVKEKIF